MVGKNEFAARAQNHDSTPLFLVAPTKLATVVWCQTTICPQLLLCYGPRGPVAAIKPLREAPIGPIKLIDQAY